MLMINEPIITCEKRASYSDRTTVLIGRSLLLLCIVIVGISGCTSPEVIDMGSYDPSYDQNTIASYYRNQVVAMREKANAQTTAAARYEALFGRDSDLVSGARLLAHYYEQTAQELERVAEAHASVARSGKRPTVVP